MSYGDRDFRVVIAIDFGTSRSGYAWAWKGDTKIVGKNLWPGQKVKYPKTPTHLLYSPDGTLEEWGAKVIKRLAQLRSKDQAKDYSFFFNFKMELYERKTGTDESPYLERDGQKFWAVNLIADYLREIKALALEEMKEQTNGTLKLSEIRWVLTVPAIWKDGDKMLMRKAAIKAGLIGEGRDEGERLYLALEPEAAAIYCQENLNNQEFLNKPGTRFMVVDCGGGTVDITVRDVIIKEGQKGLKEVIAGSGGAHGSTYVDKTFLQYLSSPEMLTADVIDDFHNKSPQTYVQLMEEWEKAKCGFEPDEEEVLIEMPAQLHELLKNNYPAILQKLAAKQSGDEYNIWLSGEVMKNQIFAPTLDKLVAKGEEILQA